MLNVAMPAADRAQLQALQQRLKEFDGRKPPPLPAAMGLSDQPGPAPKTFLLERGVDHRAAGRTDQEGTVTSSA